MRRRIYDHLGDLDTLAPNNNIAGNHIDYWEKDKREQEHHQRPGAENQKACAGSLTGQTAWLRRILLPQHFAEPSERDRIE
ncbi:MAG: hypothetical protein DDT26_02696 [Dehalococcoidia bacterium]|nr:hypothetical protein [Chloroflexota bacterium]